MTKLDMELEEPKSFAPLYGEFLGKTISCEVYGTKEVGKAKKIQATTLVIEIELDAGEGMDPVIRKWFIQLPMAFWLQKGEKQPLHYFQEACGLEKEQLTDTNGYIGHNLVVIMLPERKWDGSGYRTFGENNDKLAYSPMRFAKADTFGKNWTDADEDLIKDAQKFMQGQQPATEEDLKFGQETADRPAAKKF